MSTIPWLKQLTSALCFVVLVSSCDKATVTSPSVSPSKASDSPAPAIETRPAPIPPSEPEELLGRWNMKGGGEEGRVKYEGYLEFELGRLIFHLVCSHEKQQVESEVISQVTLSPGKVEILEDKREIQKIPLANEDQLACVSYLQKGVNSFQVQSNKLTLTNGKESLALSRVEVEK